MRVVFLEVDTERTWSVASIGPGFVGAYLRQHGHEVGFVRATLDKSDDQVVAEIAALAPDLLGVSLTTRQWLRGAHLVAHLRRTIDVPVVAGGLHPTFSPEEVLASPGFDFVCLGEGEQAAVELCEALAAGARPGALLDGRLARIANIWTRGRPRPALRAPFEPLDRLPFLARDLLDEPRGTVHMATQRGCPFPCTYCAARMYDELYDEVGAGDYGRRRSLDNVLAELEQLRADDRLGYVIFLDDTFTINHPWVRAFATAYGERIRAPFSLHARVETVNEKMLDQLAAAGCSMITYGVESGSERVRREVMHRPVTNQRFRDVFRWTREAGILLTCNFMLGLPGETRDDVEQTLALAEELDVRDFGYFVFYPYPGTQLFRVCQERGYLPADYLTRPANHRESILNLPDLSPDDIAGFYDRFTDLRRRMYLRHHGTAAPEHVAGAVDHVHDLAAVG
ncbi:MAG TPA: radical SAM protein [Kofleriaceae bacterium]|nr:radical SAM protein [Kofleriaceae bacterium]